MTCDADGFGLLTREAILARGDAKACALKLAVAESATKSRDDLLLACETQLASVPPCPKPPDQRRLLAAYAVGVVSTVLLVGGIVIDAPVAVNYSIAGVGLAGIAAGVVVISW